MKSSHRRDTIEGLADDKVSCYNSTVLYSVVLL